MISKDNKTSWRQDYACVHCRRREQENTHLFRLVEFELETSSRPGDVRGVGRVVQQRDEELPQLQGAAALVGGQRPRGSPVPARPVPRVMVVVVVLSLRVAVPVVELALHLDI